ncbi:hypothetical protein VI03_07005 [Burkholderia vietnamiensis]|uniref:hypothetical protein n=1 Tax=Burkholderia vietnamiensis TaxID=60552 RepID=UPI0006223E1F|nr:hypothetical protein [Burkholderia vietnamiensis]KKI39744.1 hypothetical protein VI03_07005 [Burkholderia vietnamiensis]
MTPHDAAADLAATCKTRNLNEADTRHQIIDRILHEVLSWPRTRTKCEMYIKEGFADYVLVGANEVPIFFVEAKKEGAYFELPQVIYAKGRQSSHVSIKALLTVPEISEAMHQVQQYCVNKGCEFAAVTNGHVWVIFRTFKLRQDWRTLNAFVIRSIDYFEQEFADALRWLAYESIVSADSINKLLSADRESNKPRYFPKEDVGVYKTLVDTNEYARLLRPIADRYFGVIDADDSDFMDHCYVSDRAYDAVFDATREKIVDSITPYLHQFGVTDFSDNGSGGEFGERLEKNIIKTKGTDVVILFGSKGVGKSTFLKRLVNYGQPEVVKNNAIVCIIDLLSTLQDTSEIAKTVWAQIVTELDRDHLLDSNATCLSTIFKELYESALKTDLYGLRPNTEAFHAALNPLVREWRQNGPLCATELAKHNRAQNRVPVIIIDNTDQFSYEQQEFCFSLAQDVAKKLECLVVISMREERFYQSSLHGLLDAYQNSGFHITAPSPRDVFLRRITYVRGLLSANREDRERHKIFIPDNDERTAGIISLLDVLRAEFEAPNSHLASILIACAHGNIRLALDLFRGFILSGYTNVREITSTSNLWKFQVHQVLRPLMIPQRFFYEEDVSHIINIFQVRSKTRGSHFTGLRILNKLTENQDPTNFPFLPIAFIQEDFVDIFKMRDDFVQCIDKFLKMGMIEANNRLDEYSDDLDSIRITEFGAFVLKDLYKRFTYIELVAGDCAVFDRRTASEIATITADEYRLFHQNKRLERVKKRLEKTQIFLNYLREQEHNELAALGTTGASEFVPAALDAFNHERETVLQSASRSVRKKQ